MRQFTQLIPPDTKIDFIRYRNIAMLISLILIAIGAVVLVMRGGFNLGVDFAGGTLVQVRLADPTDAGEVRHALEGKDLGEVTIQDLGAGGRDFLIRLPLIGEEIEDTTRMINEALTAKFGAGKFEVLRTEGVGPRVGSELRQKAILAVAFATVMMGVYIWIRFEWRFGLGAAIALFHDILITIAALVVWNYELDLNIVAALLTIVGFSVNDTVIISDRVRENRRKDHRSSLAEIINRSINETLGRTILTTGTALMTVIVLYALGGAVIHGLAFALLVGFIAGTYSTVYIAAPIVLLFERRRSGSAPRVAQRRAATAKRG